VPAPVTPSLDTFFLVMPFLVILAMAMFGLDERFASRRGKPARRRVFCEVDGEGRFAPSDPDGTPWPISPRRQIEARIIHSPASGRMESRLTRFRR
jgi:hypothetical protein